MAGKVSVKHLKWAGDIVVKLLVFVKSYIQGST